MSGETEREVSGWTTDTLHSHLNAQLAALRDHVDDRLAAVQQIADERHAAQLVAMDKALDAQQAAATAARQADERAVSAALAAAKEAVTVANEATEKRFASVNEFRAQLNDVITKMMTRVEAEALLDRIGERVQDLATASTAYITRAETIALAQRNADRISELTSRMDKAEAKVTGGRGQPDRALRRDRRGRGAFGNPDGPRQPGHRQGLNPCPARRPAPRGAPDAMLADPACAWKVDDGRTPHGGRA